MGLLHHTWQVFPRPSLRPPRVATGPSPPPCGPPAPPAPRPSRRAIRSCGPLRAALLAVAVVLLVHGCALDASRLPHLYESPLLHYTPSAAPRPIASVDPLPAIRQVPILGGPFLHNLPEEERSPDEVRALRARVAAEAGKLVGRRRIEVMGKPFPTDSGGVVRAAFAAASLPLRCGRLQGANDVAVLRDHVLRWGYLHSETRPQPADLVFFRDTRDLDRDGALDDADSDVAVVERVRDDGTVVAVHARQGTVRRLFLNLREPHRRRNPKTGQVLNTYLRKRTRSDGPGTRYLAGELWSGFGTLLKERPPASVRR